MITPDATATANIEDVSMLEDNNDDAASVATEATKNSKTTATNKHAYVISLQNGRRPENLALQHIELINIISDQYPKTVFYSNITDKALTSTQVHTLIEEKCTYASFFQVWQRKGPRDALSDIGITTMNIFTTVSLTVLNE